MLVTAKTAERMVCPMGLADGWSKSTCYGPACMGWRWFDEASEACCGVDHPETLYRRGYCGMAGKPEVE